MLGDKKGKRKCTLERQDRMGRGRGVGSGSWRGRGAVIGVWICSFGHVPKTYKETAISARAGLMAAANSAPSRSSFLTPVAVLLQVLPHSVPSRLEKDSTYTVSFGTYGHDPMSRTAASHKDMTLTATTNELNKVSHANICQLG